MWAISKPRRPMDWCSPLSATPKRRREAPAAIKLDHASLTLRSLQTALTWNEGRHGRLSLACMPSTIGHVNSAPQSHEGVTLGLASRQSISPWALTLTAASHGTLVTYEGAERGIHEPRKAGCARRWKRVGFANPFGAGFAAGRGSGYTSLE
jgi:hypothetical protein